MDEIVFKIFITHSRRQGSICDKFRDKIYPYILIILLKAVSQKSCTCASPTSYWIMHLKKVLKIYLHPEKLKQMNFIMQFSHPGPPLK